VTLLQKIKIIIRAMEDALFEIAPVVHMVNAGFIKSHALGFGATYFVEGL
jgi:hypothetical protein